MLNWSQSTKGQWEALNIQRQSEHTYGNTQQRLSNVYNTIMPMCLQDWLINYAWYVWKKIDKKNACMFVFDLYLLNNITTHT